MANKKSAIRRRVQEFLLKDEYEFVDQYWRREDPVKCDCCAHPRARLVTEVRGIKSGEIYRIGIVCAKYALEGKKDGKAAAA